jgi:transcriptional regulator with PAS, ATPase and Fis domain
MQAHCIGALIVDADGMIVRASGVAQSANVQQLLRSRCLLSGSDGELAGGLPVNGELHPVSVHRCGDTQIALLFEGARKIDRPADSGNRDALDRIIGKSVAIGSLKDEIRRVAPKDVPVLLVGESGTGKELAARSIHELSSRQLGPYVVVNAAAVPASLFESEFFGYATGAFTGADRRGRPGRLEQVHTGTLFLDEIGDMPAEVQVKLLRVLQDGRFERLGSASSTHSDFRLVSATHRDMGELVRVD